MSLSVLNNVSATQATNSLNATSSKLSTTLEQLSTGSKINSGSDDAAGLSLVNGLQANQNALAQSATNATEGVGLLQVADGALSQVTSLLDRAVTLATESANGTLNSTQVTAANQEYQSILSEISNIGTTTTYNQQQVFGKDYTIYTGDSSSSGASYDVLTFTSLDAKTGTVGESSGSISYASGSITYSAVAGAALAASLSYSNAASALVTLNTAIADVSAQDGYIGAQINVLNAASSVMSTQQTNIQSAQNAVQATDYATASSNLSKYEILSQTGISALAQANSVQQEVTKLLS